MKKKTLAFAAPFVVTVSACSRDAQTTPPEQLTHNPPMPTVKEPPRNPPMPTASTDPVPSAATSASAMTATQNKAPNLVDYPNQKNGTDAKGRTVFRGYEGKTCYAELPFPPGKRPMPGMSPPKENVTCPTGMDGPAWEECRGGTMFAKNDGSACACAQMGNPPPPVRSVKCP